jgi:hypothetical protein
MECKSCGKKSSNDYRPLTTKYPDGFQQYLEAPHDPDCVPSISWVEELGFSKGEFRTAFDKIGNRFNSKTQYKEAKSSGLEFGDKFYCSYFDRRSGMTSYYRNHKRLEKLAYQIQSNKGKV